MHLNVSSIRADRWRYGCYAVEHPVAIVNVVLSESYLEIINITLNGGSLGSWVDEERSKLRVNL